MAEQQLFQLPALTKLQGKVLNKAYSAASVIGKRASTNNMQFAIYSLQNELNGNMVVQHHLAQNKMTSKALSTLYGLLMSFKSEYAEGEQPCVVVSIRIPSEGETLYGVNQCFSALVNEECNTYEAVTQREHYLTDEVFTFTYQCEFPMKESDVIRSRFIEFMSAKGLMPEEESDDDLGAYADEAGIEW
jgi:hypothetical protein